MVAVAVYEDYRRLGLGDERNGSGGDEYHHRAAEHQTWHDGAKTGESWDSHAETVFPRNKSDGEVGNP